MKCSENLENSFNFKKLLEANRNELTRYLEVQQTVQIKKEEVWEEDYQMTEQIPTKADEGDFCSFCKSSDSVGMTGLKMPISSYACPSCGRSSHVISLYGCQLCGKNHVSISQFRQHFARVHTHHIKIELKCFACKLFFFNEKARNIHGQMQHCVDCRKRCMNDKQLIIPFEDHDRNCKNRTVQNLTVQNQPVVMRNPTTMIRLTPPSALSNILESRKDLKISRVLSIPEIISSANPAAASDCAMCSNKLGEQKPAVKR